jgi:polyhydroxyalkanoate synthesis regulator protein
MQSMMSAYMEQSQKMFQQMQEQVQGQTRNLFAGFKFPNFVAPEEQEKTSDKK